MTQLNLFDALFLVGVLFALMLGMLRGSGRETLHTFLLGAALLSGWLFLRTGAPPTNQEELARLMVSISFYTFAMYVFGWALMGILAPLFLDRREIGIRGRFWAGAQAMIKLCGLVLGINLWYAIHSTAPVWERLQPLPPLLRESVVINLSDRVTEDLHRWLAAQNFVAYQYAPEGQTPAPSGLMPSETLQRMADTSGTTPEATTPAR